MIRVELLWFGTGALLGIALASCSNAPACRANADCPKAQVCLPVGACARTCTDTSQCLSGERCSPSGGCVAASGGCGTDAECAAGQLCRPNATCGSGGTNAGATDAGGGPSATDGGTSVDAGGPYSQTPEDGGQCGERFTPTSAEANLMIVLDKSTSMNDPISGNTTKWKAATAAVSQLLAQSSSIHFGLELFSVSTNKCTAEAGTIRVGIGAGTASAIDAALATLPNADGHGTPIAAGGLAVAAGDPGLADATRAEGVVIVTDGEENCGGDPVAQVKALFSRAVPVRTWVVGFGSGVDATMLDRMAVQGGTARLTTPRYYQADVAADLQAALVAISNAAKGCSFSLSQVPPDVAKLFLGINGQLVPRDTRRLSGWDYDATSNRVTLYGQACDALANTPGATLDVQYGCANGIVEGGGDGGFHFDLDGGGIG